MSKTVYSLVLSDDVVAQIDRLAYRRGTNRSNMVNQILAEYVSYVTPEKRMQDTFRRIEALLSGQEALQLLLQPSDTMMTLRSPLAFKYNPTVRYSVELYRAPTDEIGELRVSLRTQNSNLLLYMMQFFRMWATLENRYIGARRYTAEDGKFTRGLTLTAQDGKTATLDSEALGALLCDYVKLFDASLKAFFYHLEDPQTAAGEIEARYRAYLSEQPVIL